MPENFNKNLERKRGLLNPPPPPPPPPQIWILFQNSLTRELKIRVLGFVLKKLLTYFEMLIVPHALQCADGCFLCPATKSGGVLCYTLRTFECLSVRPSVRLSVRPSAVEHSCPVHNFDTVRDNFTKLGTNVKQDQTTCRDKQPSLRLHFLRNYSPLKFSV